MKGRYPVVAIVVFVVIVAVPLVAAGRRYTTSTLTADHVAKIAAEWAAPGDWEIVSAQYRDGRVVIRAAGPDPAPDPTRLRKLLDADGEESTDVSLQLVPERRVELTSG